MPSPPPLDRDLALSRVGGDLELLQEIASLFLSTYPELLMGIREAVIARDDAALELQAHSLKGSVATFGATATVEAALTLEMLGRQRSWQGVEAALAALETALADLEPALRQWGQPSC